MAKDQSAPLSLSTALTKRCAQFRSWLFKHYPWVDADDCSQYYALKVLEGRNIDTEFHYITIDYIRINHGNSRNVHKPPKQAHGFDVNRIGSEPVYHSEEQAQLSIIKDQVHKLPKKQKEVIEMVLSGMTLPEIAKKNGTTIFAPMFNYQNALRSLRAILQVGNDPAERK